MKYCPASSSPSECPAESDDGASPKGAMIVFTSAASANRRVAGVAAAARSVRDLAEGGFEQVWLILPPGDRLNAAAEADVERLAGGMKVVVATEDGAANAAAHCVRLTDDTPRPAEILRHTAKAGDGPVSRWLNRPISRRLSALLLRLPGFRPVHATAGTALLAALMFAALILGGAQGLIAGAILFHVASVFDGVDGEVARATFRTSPAGAVFDTVVDVATNLLFILGLTANVAAAGEEWALPLAGWGFTLFVLGLAIIAWRSARLAGPFNLDLIKRHYRDRFGGRLVPAVIRFFTIVSSRDFYALLFMLLVLAGLPMAVLYLFAAAATVWILFVLGSLGASAGPRG